MIQQNRTDTEVLVSSDDPAEKRRQGYLGHRAAIMEMMREKFAQVHGKDAPFKVCTVADRLQRVMG